MIVIRIYFLLLFLKVYLFLYISSYYSSSCDFFLLFSPVIPHGVFVFPPGGNTDRKFTIDRWSGKISCSPLDRETISSYNLTILAKDGGSPPLTNTSVMRITVVDENDNNPQFELTSYTATLLENATIGTSVLTTKARDFDQGVNAVVTYSLDNDSEGLFKIDTSTGLITTTG